MGLTTNPIPYHVESLASSVVQEPRHVLIAEDDPVYCRILQRLLERERYEITIAGDGMEALTAATSPPYPRLLVLDWMMPSLPGPEVCRRLRERNSDRYQYILLLTGKDAKADIVAGLEAGADDYLTKPFNSGELLARVQVGMRTLRLHDGLLAAQEQLRFHATHDFLTSLWNRVVFGDLFRAELERSRRANVPLVLLMVDIDRFKSINDSYGHAAGDEVLQEVARRWSANIRPYDVLSRFGGEEFVVCAAGLDMEVPLEYAERLRTVIATRPAETTFGSIPVTVSIGMTVADPNRKPSLEVLLHRADAALYLAKSKGRNRVEVLEMKTSP